MRLEETLALLKSTGDERAVEIWKRFGMPDVKYYGVCLTKIARIAGEIKRDHELALELWDSGVHDARLLATHIIEPKKVDEALIDRWVESLNFMDVCDKFCTNVVLKTAFAQNKMETWTKSDKEYTKRAGYKLFTALAHKGKLSADTIRLHLTRIEADIRDERNWVKEMMLYALIAIGEAGDKLRQEALEAAKRIGPVAIDYGQSSCKPPDPLAKLSRP